MGVGVVLAAAGAGRRLGARSNKVLLPLAGKPIILHSLEVFAALKEVSEIVVVTRDVDVPYVKEITRDFGCRVISGGKTRQESVYLGLQALSDAVNWVIIHDGARPYLTKDTVLAVLEACYKKGAAGAAVPVTDTIKVVKGSRISGVCMAQS
ncbi:MAG TPA: NTP transferase domain-containing protein, partial [Firmicutes bacterium]|nr:NTP transferase domain-containing protein [Bacillota bacterium]